MISALPVILKQKTATTETQKKPDGEPVQELCRQFKIGILKRINIDRLRALQLSDYLDELCK